MSLDYYSSFRVRVQSLLSVLRGILAVLGGRDRVQEFGV